ncbi:MAG TPA: S-adenosylmethionine:tRNA ribosyltransferase-isomerase [Acidimicrobiales bacterium]|nr:S-adenosylmethionine:tRNA ribosyltransferase-isomerase [Acidimicrobiales bacterium]
MNPPRGAAPLASAGGASAGHRPVLPASRYSFDLPSALEAAVPPEARGVTRDAVRMMVAYAGDGRVVHSTFSELPRFLDAGDLVVVNTSGTIPAALDGVRRDRGEHLVVHLSTHLPGGLWVVELRALDGAGTVPYRDGRTGIVVDLPAGASLTVDAAYSDPPGRLWTATLDGITGEVLPYLARSGRPIRYGYVRGSWPITMYQNVYATEPGSAEMPSAGRPFTADVITRLVAKGVHVAPLVLHTGVASLESHEAPYPEYFRVPATTAHAVNDTRAQGGRVVAVGTTVVRALESATDERGVARGAEGWTDVVITPERGVRSVDGLLTGWHEPEASHLAMLEAVAGEATVRASYDAALEHGYLWHEFGDVHLVLP